jgi:hypothetical protein
LSAAAVRAAETVVVLGVRHIAPTRKGETVGLIEAESDLRNLIRSRVAFDAIEEWIGAAPGLDDQERGALWLYAWSRQGRRWQRNTASQLLAWVGGDL